jgi:hypothetical protein
LRERGAELTRVLTMQSALLMYYEDTTSLAELLRERTAPPSDVRYVMVLDNGGGVVWSTFDNGVPHALLKVPHPTPVGTNVNVQLIEAQGEQIFDYEASQAGVRLRLGMSVTPVQKFASELTTYILWIGVAGLLAVFAVALHVSRPVEALTVGLEIGRDGWIARAGPGCETSALAAGSTRHSDGWTSARASSASRKLATSAKLDQHCTDQQPLGTIVLNADFCRSARTERYRAGRRRDPAVGGRHARDARIPKLLQFSRYSTRVAHPQAAASRSRSFAKRSAAPIESIWPSAR